MKILVTGHKGFVGKYIIRKYKTDHQIVGIDLKDNNECRDYFKKNLNTYFDLVFHLAAIVGGRQTIEGNPLAVADDLSIDSEFIQWCLKTKPGRVIYFSSSAAYPIKLQKLEDRYRLKETDINLMDCSTPDMTYGWAKLTGEFCLQYLEEENIKVNIFRPFSGYGTDQDLAYPFPSYIKRGKEKYDPFEVWGNGEQVRDFIHMQDIVDAVDEAIKQDIKGPVNLGSGIATSFNELQKMICKQVGYTPDVKHILTAPVGVMYRCCDPTKMLSFYKPKISLDEGIARALKGII
jgi:nucleoside-diphosphate-sugar epimerase